MNPLYAKILVVAGIAAAVGYLAYLEAGLAPGIIVLVFTSIIVGSLSSGMAVWSSIGALKNPLVGFLVFFMLGFIYLSFQGAGAWFAAAKSVGIGFLGAVLSMIFFNYWNIGG